MSKHIKTLIIIGVAVLLLVAATVVLLLLPQQEGDPDESQKDTTVVLQEKGEKVTVTSIEVTYQDQTYRLHTDKDGEWLIKDYEDLPVDASAVKTITGYMLSLKADKKVHDSTEKPEDFGLDKPAAVYHATYSDGTDYSFEVGDAAPSGDGYYLRQQDDAAIYLIGTYKGGLFCDDVRAYVSTTMVTTPSINADDKNGASTILKAEISGTAHKEMLRYHSITDKVADEFPYSNYYISKPYRIGVSLDSEVETLVSEIRTLSALNAEILHPTDKQIKECGLDKPSTELELELAILTYDTDENGDIDEYRTYNYMKHNVIFGGTTKEGYYYAMVDGIDVIYCVTKESIPWIDMTYNDIAADTLFFRDISTVGSISISYDGKQHTFDLTHLKDVDANEENMRVTIDGKKTGDTAQFRRLYQVLMNVPRIGSATKPKEDPAVTVKVTNTDGEIVVNAKLYKRSASTYACEQLNGEVYAVSAATIEDLLEQTDNYIAGKTVSIV